ncbi:MAG: molybdate ABC transporter substrate-binding protein [Chthoniobacterales bacterium]
MKRLTVLFTLFLCLSADGAQLTVHAAASLTDAMKEIAASYERQSTQKVRLNFDASSILARQIEEGAPADIFLSADEAKMDELEGKNLLAPRTRQSLLRNTLAIVVPAESKLVLTSARDLVREGAVRKIAIAQPTSVPAGIYAKEYLVKLGLWDELAARMVPTQNVRAGLAAVASGNVEAGLVYKTDALISREVRIACEIPAGEGPKISYSVAALVGSTDLVAAKKFLAYLESEPALAVFRKYGFSTVR